jgi:hypothetical protein
MAPTKKENRSVLQANFKASEQTDRALSTHIGTFITYQTMAESSLTTLIGDEIQGYYEKWSDFVDGEDGFFYGIPSDARRVVKFNPLDKSLTEIGPDLGNRRCKWRCGVRAKNGSIYCAPYYAEHILKINTNDDTVETLDDVELPQTGGALWASGALAQDNFIYYMPDHARRIMKLNSHNDTLSSVGANLGGGPKYCGTVIGNDDYVYGMTDDATCIVKFHPANPYIISNVGGVAEEDFMCDKGVVGGDGYIYAANRFGQVLKVDTTRNNCTWIGDRIFSGRCGAGWGDAIIGVDKCIYWPPLYAKRVLKFDPETQQLPSLVGDDLGGLVGKWRSGALAATDGVIYCIPSNATQVLAIDPFKELSMTLQNNFTQHPQELGRLFVKDEKCDETFYKSAVRKFGIEKVFQLIEKCTPLDVEWANTHSNALPLFMVAASCENSAVSVIYHLLRRNVHALLVND